MPGQAARGRRGRHADRAVRRAARSATRPEGKTYDKPFRYHDLGSAAYISRGHAVVSAFGLNFGGFLGWLVWLFIHIGFLTGYRNRVGAVLGWWFAFTRDLRRERTFTIDDMPVAVRRRTATQVSRATPRAPACDGPWRRCRLGRIIRSA